MEAVIQSIRSERDETNQQRGENVMTRINHETQSPQKVYQEKAACQEATEADAEETEPDPGMMQSAGEHQEIPKEEAAVMPVGGLRKRRRDRNLAAGRRQKPKGRIQAIFESEKKSTVADRKVSSRAAVAGRRRDVFTHERTRVKCGPMKQVVAARRGTTSRSRVVWHKRGVVRRDCTRTKVERTTRKNLRTQGRNIRDIIQKKSRQRHIKYKIQTFYIKYPYYNCRSFTKRRKQHSRTSKDDNITPISH
jgi:hypothetical protein